MKKKLLKEPKQKVYNIGLLAVDKDGEEYSNYSSLTVIADSVFDAIDKVGKDILQKEKEWNKDLKNLVVESVIPTSVIDLK